MTPTDADPFVSPEAAPVQRPPRRPKKGSLRKRPTPARRAAAVSEEVPFSEQIAPETESVPEPETPATEADADTDTVEVPFTELQAMQLKLLWDEYEQRQRQADKPKTMQYRCIGLRPDGAVCGAIVTAGTHVERIRSGEIVRCPHGPDAPDDGIVFDRERFPKFHYDLTPMEPIW